MKSGIRRKYLLSHIAFRMQPLNSGCTHYNMRIETVWMWGLFRTYETIPYNMPYNEDFVTTRDHWERLINERIDIN